MRQVAPRMSPSDWGQPDDTYVRERILIMTHRHLIDGVASHPQGVRLSDTLNSPVHSQRPYLPLAEVSVSHLESGKQLFTTSFLLVKRTEIVSISPVENIASIGPPEESDTD